MKTLTNLVAYQPIQMNPGVIRSRTLLKMEVGMESDFVSGV
jgi:hypothetical protein